MTAGQEKEKMLPNSIRIQEFHTHFTKSVIQYKQQRFLLKTKELLTPLLMKDAVLTKTQNGGNTIDTRGNLEISREGRFDSGDGWSGNG